MPQGRAAGAARAQAVVDVAAAAGRDGAVRDDARIFLSFVFADGGRATHTHAQLV
jgi:hypothetical protein